LRNFGYFVAFNATGANPLAHDPALRALDTDFLQVGIETPPGAIVRVRDVITELRPFAADFASFCHDCFLVPPNSKKRAASVAISYRCGLEARGKPKYIAKSFTRGQARSRKLRAQVRLDHHIKIEGVEIQSV